MFWEDEKFKGMSRKEKEKEFRRQTILTAAMEALLDSSYSELTMNQIAAKAELSAASLYLFFPNKRCLLGEMLLQFFEPTIQNIEQSIAKFPSWEDQLRAFVENHLVWGSKDNADFVYMINDIFYFNDNDVPAELTQRFVNCRGRLLDIIRQILGTAFGEDEIGFDREFLVLSLVGSLEAIHYYSGLKMISGEPEDFVDEAIKMVKRLKGEI